MSRKLFDPIHAVSFAHWRLVVAYRLRMFWRFTLPQAFCRHKKTEPCVTWTSSYDICIRCLKHLNWRAHGRTR